MKIFINNIFLLLIVAFTSMSVYAKVPDNLPPPQTLSTDPPPGEDVEGPIDENIILLGFIGLLFGSYTIHKNKYIKKAS